MRVSIVIPVYNEASQIAACLWAIARQTVRPYEVIVVDNNSTDGTASIAASFPFVTVLNEEIQGVVHARNRGFDAVSGDIIGRLDADSRVSEDWVARVITNFTDQPEIQALSGSIHYHDIACQRLVSGIDMHIRAWLGRRTAGAVYLLGANMAIRTEAWRQVGASTCRQSGLHEDLDLAAHLSLAKKTVVYEPLLVSGVSGRRADTDFVDFLRYLLSMPNTYRSHRLWQRIHFYPVMLLVAICYLFLRAIYRGYDQSSRAFRWRRLLSASIPKRANPTIAG